MVRGGRRVGAGRPKGSKNKRTIAKVPLMRRAAAKAAAPYYHAKVSSGPPKASFEMTQSELENANRLREGACLAPRSGTSARKS